MKKVALHIGSMMCSSGICEDMSRYILLMCVMCFACILDHPSGLTFYFFILSILRKIFLIIVIF